MSLQEYYRGTSLVVRREAKDVRIDSVRITLDHFQRWFICFWSTVFLVEI